MVALANTPIVPSSDLLDCRVAATDLKRAAATLARIADRKSSLPMLQHVLIRVDTHGMTLVATDLNTYASITVPVRAHRGAGSICVNAKSFADLVKTLDGEEIHVGQTGALGLAISDGSSNVTLIGLNSRDFPKIPVRSTESILHSTVPMAFADMIERVTHAVCKDETRFHLNGVLIECDGTTTRMVTTDGHRLTRHDAKLSGALTKGVILPTKAATEIAKILKAHKGYECSVAFDRSMMFVKCGQWDVATKLVDAQFPAYEQVIPKDYGKLATVDRKLLVAALKRATKLCTSTRGAKLTFASGKLTVQCDHPEQGTTTESLKAESQWLDLGNRGTFGINPNYLLDLLGEIDDKLVTIAFGGELDPVLVRSTEDATSYDVAGSRFLGVVMPMRI